MHAIVQDRYGSADTWRYEQTRPPECGPGQVLLDVRAAAVDRGTWHLMTGRPYLVRVVGPTRPHRRTPGLDVAGVVRAAGAKVSGLAPGDEVFGVARGSLAEVAVAPARQLAVKPPQLTFPQAAALPVSGCTALQGVRDAGRLTAGSRVLVLGASGGVGSYAVQIAKALGGHVVGVASAAKADLVLGLGADEARDYAADDLATPGGYDLVLDMAGTAPMAQVRRLLAPRGTLVLGGGEVGGALAGSLPRQVRGALLNPFTRQRLVMLASTVTAGRLRDLADLAAAGAVTPALDRVFALPDAADAMRLLESGQVRGKVAVEVAGA